MLHPIRRPRLCFIDPPEGTDPAAGGAATERGFPANTPIEQMTVEQREAYWKFYARKHEGERDAARAEATTKATELATSQARVTELERAGMDDHQRALAEAEDKGRREALASASPGGDAFLADAVSARLEQLTGKSPEDVATALAFVDVDKFKAADGTLDLPKLTSFAATLGTTPSESTTTSTPPPRDAVRAAMGMTSATPQGRGTGSIRDRVAERAAELKPTK